MQHGVPRRARQRGLPPAARMAAALVASLGASLGIAGCSGADLTTGGPEPPRGGEPGGAPPRTEAASPTGPATPDPPAPAAAPRDEPPFSITRERLRLLPFETRLKKLSALSGVSLSDPIFEAFRAKRIELGDSNYALGVTPDSSWSPPKMVLWAKLLRPLCNAAAFRARYPQVGSDPGPLMTAAFARPAGEEEKQTVMEGVMKLAPARRAELACVTVLSSAELVAQ